jgi:hypothetical protein
MSDNIQNSESNPAQILTHRRGPDTTREYRTRRGDRVVLHDFVTHNSPGALVTFPIKGTFFDKDRPRKKTFNIWTLEGRSDIFGPGPNDIIDLAPVLVSSPPPCLDCAG